MAEPGIQNQDLTERLNRTYSSLSGVDIRLRLGRREMGNAQGISFTVTREKAPIYVMGAVDPLGFSRGKRGIAGSLIAVVTDATNIMSHLDDDQKVFWADWDEVSDLTLKAGGLDGSDLLTGFGNIAGEGTRAGSWSRAGAWYHDQVLPFTIGLTGANEVGHAMDMEIRGVEILNIGSGISVDDITTDENFTFIARILIPWRKRPYASPVNATRYLDEGNFAVGDAS